MDVLEIHVLHAAQPVVTRNLTEETANYQREAESLFLSTGKHWGRSGFQFVRLSSKEMTDM